MIKILVDGTGIPLFSKLNGNGPSHRAVGSLRVRDKEPKAGAPLLTFAQELPICPDAWAYLVFDVWRNRAFVTLTIPPSSDLSDHAGDVCISGRSDFGVRRRRSRKKVGECWLRSCQQRGFSLVPSFILLLKPGFGFTHVIGGRIRSLFRRGIAAPAPQSPSGDRYANETTIDVFKPFLAKQPHGHVARWLEADSRFCNLHLNFKASHSPSRAVTHVEQFDIEHGQLKVTAWTKDALALGDGEPVETFGGRYRKAVHDGSEKPAREGEGSRHGWVMNVTMIR